MHHNYHKQHHPPSGTAHAVPPPIDKHLIHDDTTHPTIRPRRPHLGSETPSQLLTLCIISDGKTSLAFTVLTATSSGKSSGRLQLQPPRNSLLSPRLSPTAGSHLHIVHTPTLYGLSFIMQLNTSSRAPCSAWGQWELLSAPRSSHTHPCAPARGRHISPVHDQTIRGLHDKPRSRPVSTFNGTTHHLSTHPLTQ
jgi:hypothetical protein